MTTHLVSAVVLLEQQPALLRKFLAAPVELTEWIHAHPDEVKRLFNEAMRAFAHRALPLGARADVVSPRTVQVRGETSEVCLFHAGGVKRAEQF